MSLRVFNQLLDLFRGAGSAFCDAAVFTLLCLPLAAFLAAFILLVCVKKIRPRTRVWFPVFGDVCLFLLLALFLCGGDIEDSFPVLALLLCVKAGYLLLYGALCLIPVRAEEKKNGKRQKSKKQAFFEEKDEVFDLPAAAAPLSETKPQKVRCYSDDERVVVDKDVRLEHISSVLERLKELPLGAGDRLESQKIGELLAVYRAKTQLNPREADTLNDILASLLKMMAKYDL